MGVVELSERPAEAALLAGLRTYEEGQYPEAERYFNQSLQKGLAAPRDVSTAQKYLAFIYCSSQRMTQCETAFKAARSADAKFSLSKAEVGHPLWGPVYRKLFGP